MKRINKKVIEGFGDEWLRFNQSNVNPKELKKLFFRYFDIFPFEKLSKNSIGFDLGCGTGRWAKIISNKVGKLYCVEPSKAIEVAKKNLLNNKNCFFINDTVENLSIENNSMDFGYSLGVLHHVDNTYNGIKTCIDKLKSNAPFLIYLYYSLDNKPKFYKFIWKISNIFRKVISRLPLSLRFYITQLLCVLVYYPFAKFNLFLSKLKINVNNLPLHSYKDLSFYTMRTDALDRLGTRLEKRFSKKQIKQMLSDAGLKDIVFSKNEPFWCAVGYKKEQLISSLNLKDKYQISLIIPVYNNYEDAYNVIELIYKQSFLPKEIIIVDSSTNTSDRFDYKKFSPKINIIYKKILKSNPGKARNIGVEVSSYEWITFIDTNTIPLASWLIDSVKGLDNNNLEVAIGNSISLSSTYYQDVIKALTYGNKEFLTLPGTLVSKSLFLKLGFFSDERAGEDVEWIGKINQLDIEYYTTRSFQLKYLGFPNNLFSTVVKWYTYTISNAKLNVLRDQKLLYLFSSFIIFIYFIYNWNANFAILETSPLYIPHVTKVTLGVSFLLYLLFRGLIRPLKVSENFFDLFPFRWIYIGWIGLILDLVKAPGMIYGSILYIYRKLFK